jgi:intergrase/recombinase
MRLSVQFTETDDLPFYRFKRVDSNYSVVYFPFGYPKGANTHWFIYHWEYLHENQKSHQSFFEASYYPIDSLKGKVADYQELVIPHELKDPKNKDRWKNVARE